MKSLLNITVYSFYLILLVACAASTQYGKLEQSARQQYQSGNYDQAVYDSAASLRINPTYDKSQTLIQEAFRVAVDVHKSRIDELNPSTSKFKWDDIVSEYEQLIKLNKTVRELPTLINQKTNEVIKFEVVDYSKNLADAKTNAAEAHYQEGLRLSKQENTDFQKKAAIEFKAAQSFVPGYKDAGEFYEKSRRAGIKRIAIIPFADKSGKAGRYGAIAEETVDGIVSQVMNDQSATEFLEIVSRDQLEQVMHEQKLMVTDVIDEKTVVQAGKILGVHEFVTGKITQIVVTPERTTNSTVREETDVCDNTRKYIDKDGKKQEECIWSKAFANVTKYKRTAGATISGSYNIIDVKTAKVKDSQSFKGEYKFDCVWARISGDKRALSKDSQDLVAKDEQVAPVAEEMVNKAVGNLSDTLASSFKRYAR
jgi:hypothetical protein